MHRKASMLCVLAAAFVLWQRRIPPRSRPFPFRASSRTPRGRCSRGRPSKPVTRLAGTNTAVTNADGVYRFPALPPGTYEITATLQGFKPAKLTDTVLELGRNLVIDLTMSLATVTEKCRSPPSRRRSSTSRATPPPPRSPAATIERMPKGRDFTTHPPSGARRAGRVEGRRHPDRRLVRLREPLRSSTAWTPPTCRPASRARRCCSTSSTKCRSSRPATTPSSAAPPAASSTC